MSTHPVTLGNNRLLNLLIDSHRRDFVSNCELVTLHLGEVLGNPGDAVSYVYFPVEGIISCGKQMTGNPHLVVSLVGNEGMLCISLLLGSDIRTCRAVVQKAGFALRISSATFIDQIQHNPALDLILKRYAYVTYNQVMQAATCNLFHLLENRLAKLLLMFQDRSESDELHLTQEHLAKMLGVRRVGVTKAAGSLQRQNLISYIRGSVIIHNTKGLKAVACICYQEDITNSKNILHI